MGIVKLDNSITVGYRNSNTNISIVDIENNRRRDIIPRGAGPGEAAYVNGPTAVDNNIIAAIDINTGNLFKCNIKQALKDSAYQPQIHKLPENARSLIMAVSDTFMIATGLYKEGKYMYYSFPDDTYNFFLDYAPFPGYDDMSLETQNILFRNNMLEIRPDKKAFACVNINCGMLDICNIDGKKIEEVKNICYYYPKVHIDEGKTASVAYARDNDMGFEDVEVTNDYIYVLFSGRKYSEEGADAFTCHNLLVFDWTGNPVKAYELDIPLTYISYDEKERAIYGIGYNPEAVLVKYNL
ncbi:MAG: BF3164 family lipoprotein [Bacteroidales bacterium]|nr:BF3164 family lipoprotein [Bacteroidales bacterium]